MRTRRNHLYAFEFRAHRKHLQNRESSVEGQIFSHFLGNQTQYEHVLVGLVLGSSILPECQCRWGCAEARRGRAASRLASQAPAPFRYPLKFLQFFDGLQSCRSEVLNTFPPGKLWQTKWVLRESRSLFQYGPRRGMIEGPRSKPLGHRPTLIILWHEISTILIKTKPFYNEKICLINKHNNCFAWVLGACYSWHDYEKLNDGATNMEENSYIICRADLKHISNWAIFVI